MFKWFQKNDTVDKPEPPKFKTFEWNVHMKDDTFHMVKAANIEVYDDGVIWFRNDMRAGIALFNLDDVKCIIRTDQ